MRNVIKKLKEGTEYLNYGRHIIFDWGAQLTEENNDGSFLVLDLGCGPGTDLDNIQNVARTRNPEKAKNLKLFGIESWPPNVKKCQSLGITTWNKNIELDKYPGKDQSFDLIIANQVLEHTKEIFWIFAEVARLLKPGGHFIVGVPNIASLHNRLLLLFGQQPTQIQSLSAHVRGFTKPDMRHFAQTGGLFELVGFRGSNFYPFPPFISKPLARLFPTLAWGSFYKLKRTAKQGSFLECLQSEDDFLETPFYGSPQNPSPEQLRVPVKKSSKKTNKKISKKVSRRITKKAKK